MATREGRLTSGMYGEHDQAWRSTSRAWATVWLQQFFNAVEDDDRCGQVDSRVDVCPTRGPTYSDSVKTTELPSEGVAETWTVLQVAPKGFPSPLVHCVFDLGGVKVAGTVFGTSKIRIGEQMQVIEDPSGRFPFVLSPKENGHSTQ